MDKKLPKVFANPLNKKINNSQETLKVINNNSVFEKSNLTVDTKIRRIFNSPNYVYKSTVIIEDDKGIREKVIVGRTNDSLITQENELINILNIKDIKKKD